MQCPKGSEVKTSEHQIKTIEKAREWFAGVQKYDLPITVRKDTARNGRCMITVYDNVGKKIHSRG